MMTPLLLSSSVLEQCWADSNTERERLLSAQNGFTYEYESSKGRSLFGLGPACAVPKQRIDLDVQVVRDAHLYSDSALALQING